VKYRPTCGTWALSADPELASLLLSAILLHGPVNEPLFDTYAPCSSL
jgi:hypothetical protein